ncbi:lipopolysaccharide biosynthesis protein [Flavobacterium sp. EDS]|uniref:lipopolysaccharide biosynthesis protein n=1 Tax=Flavobacterium sp. EDS TaxID=2897328 RepID=UPI001E28A8FA|nr:lipopolysaccharide biosynthesis protein [Flavobacterium sp. EDS]MCD0473665.1 lipopolysaccharide biosynthesis protein [Flavobacterium sp. EDS]
MILQDSYTKNYIKIYFWQGISLILNFFSMFIVIPYLTANPVIYGVYTICISISIFLSYADLGFISAGQKYASESFARGKIEEEIKVIGFSNFILLLILIFFTICFFVLSCYPELIVQGLIDGPAKSIASSLFFILALFTPITLLQRILQMICGVRLEDFIIQRSNIIASILKILSVLWFFGRDKYDIVGYFGFTQIVNLVASIITICIIKKRYNYNFILLLKSIRFRKEVFFRVKNLAFTSFFLTLAWILYYELDPIVIGRLLGPKQVAIYAIGLTILSFFRSILGILFSPFNARFNHFIGNNDKDGLESFFLQIVTILAPLIVLPIVTISMLVQPLLLSWVGSDYLESVVIARFLVLCNLFAFITYPTGILLMAKEKIKDMYLISALLPFVFWIGILGTFNIWGLKAFAIFKMTAFVLSALSYYYLMLKYTKVTFIDSLANIFKPMLVPICFVIITCLSINDFLPHQKAKLNLAIVACVAGALIIISFGIQYMFSNKWRVQVSKIIRSFKN